mgnify:CR=1 FL=1
MSSESEHLAQAVARLSRRLRQERQSELTATQFSVLRSVYLLGPATPSQIAAAEKVSQPSVTRTLNCLLESGHIAKSPHPDDGRQVLIKMSEMGEQTLSQERRRRDLWLDAQLVNLSSADRALLHEAADLFLKIAQEDT